MKVCFTTEERFFRTPDGHVWSPGNTPSYSFFQRYLAIFDEMCVIARVADAVEPSPAWKRADGKAVTFGLVPNYTGPVQYVRRIQSVHAAVRKAIGSNDAVILRIGSQIASSAERALYRGRPFGLEVVGDPYNVFAPGANKHLLRPFWRWWFTSQMRRQCAKASAISYVTERTLQQHYPPASSAFCTSFSAIELGEDAFTTAARTFSRNSGPIRILTIGSLEQPYKGVDILIDAVATAIAQGQQLHLTVVGRGRFQSDLEQQAVLRGISKHVSFAGEVTSSQLRRELDQAQLFVLASRTEGLPRVVIEAMAQGLPCIGSAVGGIPELLSAEDLVPPSDAPALAKKIVEVVEDPARMERMSATNLIRARDYSNPVMEAKRQEFLLHLQRATQDWLTQRKVVSVR